MLGKKSHKKKTKSTRKKSRESKNE